MAAEFKLKINLFKRADSLGNCNWIIDSSVTKRRKMKPRIEIKTDCRTDSNVECSKLTIIIWQNWNYWWNLTRASRKASMGPRLTFVEDLLTSSHDGIKSEADPNDLSCESSTETSSNSSNEFNKSLVLISLLALKSPTARP